MEQPTTVCIIGAGPGGIAMGYHLKRTLKCNDFLIVDQNAGAGELGSLAPTRDAVILIPPFLDVRLLISLPLGCDVPSHFYSFSFALNANWSRPLCEQGEILDYLNSVVDRFDLRPHMTFSTAVLGAIWDESTGTWEVTFKNLKSGYEYARRFNVLVSACGVFSRPKYPDLKGMGDFQGRSWHSGKWDHTYDLTNKKVAVIGNGCSGCQIIPAIAPQVKSLTHFTRSKQWLFERQNMPFTSVQKWAYRSIPGWMRWKRFKVYYDTDALFLEYVRNPAASTLRAKSEKQARDYMVQKCPAEYLDKIMPDYPVGCKRRVFDPGYLDSLHRENVELRDERIAAIDETGIKLQDGSHQEFDTIIYATGFHTQEFLAPMTIRGQGGKSLTDHWKETHGCQAYMGTTVSGFPNMAIMFGPNASPAHNSVIFTLEVQAEYIVQTILEPIITNRAEIVVVKRSAEDYDCNVVQRKLEDSVWHAGCTNWQLDESGRNCTSFPGYVRSFWWKLYAPKFQDYIFKGGQTDWYVKYLTLKSQQNMSALATMLSIVVVGTRLAGRVIATSSAKS